MAVYSIYLISRSGSLLYQKDFPVNGSPLMKLNSNDYLVIASTLHGVHAIASKLTAPEAATNWQHSKVATNSNKFGLQSITTERFRMSVLQTVSGLKIIVITSPNLDDSAVRTLQNRVYDYYTDYVLKNPFYRLEMPIRLRSFEDKVLYAVTSYNV